MLSRIAQTYRVQLCSHLARVFLAAILCTGIAGCRTLPWPKDKEKGAATDEPESPAPRPATTLPVGTVHLVDENAGFVLIRSSRVLQIEPGTMLQVHGNQGEVVATLEVSPARKGSFLTGDLRWGAPKKGQQVTMDYLPPAAGSQEAAPFPSASDPNAIQVLE